MSMLAKIEIARFEAENLGQEPNFILLHPYDTYNLLHEITQNRPGWMRHPDPTRIDGMIIINAQIPHLLGNPKAIQLTEPKI